MFAGDMFFPPALMISSFLRSTMLQVAVVVELADVAGVEPAVGVDRLARLLGHVAVAGRDERAADQHLAVVGELDLRSRRGRADRADPDLVRRIDGAVAAGLGHPPQLRRAGCRCAWKNSITSGGVGAAPTFTDSTSSRPSIARILDSTSSSAFACSCGSSHLLPRAPSAGRGRAPTSWPASSRSSCSASMPASIAAFSFSQMRGTAKNQRGSHLGQVRHDLARVRAAGGR